MFPLDPLPGSGGAGGSGCSPGAGPLPDGIWFGMVTAKDATSVTFDLACFFFGSIAYTKGAADGVTVDDDYYIRNQNPTLRTVPVRSDAVVYELEPNYNAFLTEPYAAWPHDNTMLSMICPAPSGCMVWLAVNGGDVTEIMEQYTP